MAGGYLIDFGQVLARSGKRLAPNGSKAVLSLHARCGPLASYSVQGRRRPLMEHAPSRPGPCPRQPVPFRSHGPGRLVWRRHPGRFRRAGAGATSITCGKTKTKATPEKTRQEPGLGLKAVWYSAEQFGNLIGLTKGGNTARTAAKDAKRLTRREAIATIRNDYSKNYFVSGAGEMEAYAADCYFADPFAGFVGTARFKRNVSNLGGLLSDIKLDVSGWEERGAELITKWQFSAILDLPWRPRLAAGGRTTHVFDEDTGLVVKHIEEWDAKPARVVRSLIRPSARMPTNRWEAFFGALDAGDAQGMWLAASMPAAKLSGVLVAASLLARAATGHGFPGSFLGAVEGMSYIILVASGITEVVKVVRG